MLRPELGKTAIVAAALSAMGGGWAINPFGRPDLLDEHDDGTENGGVTGNPGGGSATATAAPPNGGGEGGGRVTQSAELGEFEPLLTEIDNRLNQSLTPIREEQAELRGRIEQSRQPAFNAHALFGGQGIRTGEDPLTSRGYQLYRAYGYRMGSGHCPAEQCKVELDLHNRLRKFYVEQGGMELAGDNSVLVPYGSSEIHEFDEGFGSEVRQMLAAGLAGANPYDMRAAVKQAYGARYQQALSMFDDTALGIFTDPGGAGEIIDLVRNREVFSRVGATQLTLPPNGYLKINKQTGATTGYWVGESQEITESEPTTGSIELRAKKSASLVTIPNELLRWGTPSVEAFIRMDIARVLSLLADLAFLEGEGTTTRPRGLITYGNILTHTAGTVATDGNTFEPEDAPGMVSDVEEQNHDPEADGFAWVMRAKMWKNIRIRRSGEYDGSSIDSTKGGWLFMANREDIANGQPSRLEGYPVVKSAQVSNTRSKGASSDLTYILAGIFRHFLIANAGVMEFATSVQGDTVFKQDQTKLRAIRHVDAAPRYEDAFVLCDSIDMDLPA